MDDWGEVALNLCNVKITSKTVFAKCICQRCNGHIEFASDYAGTQRVCPHCGLVITLFISTTPLPQPKIKNTPTATPLSSPLEISRFRSQARIDYLTSIGVPDADKLDDPNHPWKHERASPKQAAYLKYMGVSNADQLSKSEAAELIETNPFLDGAKGLAELERILSHQKKWHRQRLILYPDLYDWELRDFLRDDLPRSLHAFVRNQMVGASERLTKSKIRHVVNTLTDENARWWHESDYQTVFLERLKHAYPKCCDGHAPIAQV
jgi:hypothetical protein